MRILFASLVLLAACARTSATVGLFADGLVRPGLDVLKNYPSTMYFEGTNFTEGRGTERPFEQIGAPWLNAQKVARVMNAKGLRGIRFEAITMAVEPTARSTRD